MPVFDKRSRLVLVALATVASLTASLVGVAGVRAAAPVVNAGEDFEVTLPSNGLLEGTATDDGGAAALTTTWTQIAGPDSAVIAQPGSLTTGVSFRGSGTGNYTFRLTASDGGSTTSDDVAVAVLDPGTAPNMALDFDGSNDHVTFGNPAALGLSTFTIETWFRRDGGGVSMSTGNGGVTAIPLVTKGKNDMENWNRDMNWFLGIEASTGLLVADLEEGAAGAVPGRNHPVKGTTVIAEGLWYHAAATYDGATWQLYLNGTLEATRSVGQPPRADSIHHAGLGTSMAADGVPVGFFAGALDEVRVWNVARSGPQIAAGATGPLRVSPGLVARWSMDEGTGTTIASTAGVAVDGTVKNGPTWTQGTPFVSAANAAPNTPTLVAPGSGATGVSANPSLQVGVVDPNADALTTTFYGRPSGPVTAEDFTFVVIPDTQHYVDAADRTGQFNAQTQWIADNEDDLNVVFVSHLGDITQGYDADEVEWQRADSAMDILDNAGIPNNLAPGNHDMGMGATSSNFYDAYFPPSRYNMDSKPWYGGWLGEETGQIQRQNKDNYELFRAGGIDFLVIHLEVDMPNYAVQWANEIIDRYPDRQVILSTHGFVDQAGARPTARITARTDGLSAADVWTQLVAPNCNVFMVVNGHYPGESRAATNNACGKPVHQLLTDYQNRANGGDGWLRYYTFRPSANAIEAHTWSPTLNQFETDANSRFTLTWDMSRISALERIGSVETASGATASVAWPNRAPNTTYEWYAVTSDGIASRTTPTWTFTTAPAPVGNRPPVVSNPGPQSAAEGATVDLPVAASDPDGDALAFEATNLPAGLSIGPVNGRITGTVSFDAAAGSPYEVTISVDDGTAAPSEASFVWSVTPTNRQPIFDQDLGNRTDGEGSAITVDAGATDPDGDAVTYAATGLPAGVTIDPGSGQISGTIAAGAAAGSPYAVSVTVRDGPDVDATDTFLWTVSAPSGDTAAPTAGRPLVRLVPGTTVATTATSYVYWPAADTGGSGLARFRVDMRTDGGAWTRVNSSTTVPYITRVLNTGTTTTYQFRVQALDNAGNASAWYEGPVLRLPIVQETDTAIRYLGTWSAARPVGALGGTTRYSTQAKSVAEYTFRGRGYALIAPMGPAQGSVDVWVDGKLVKTVNLHASRSTPRVAVYSTAWDLWGTHTVRLVVKGTAGHPRVDVDAVVLGG